MECRCYRGDKNRTKLVKLSFGSLDALFFLFGLIFMGAIIALKILPYNYAIEPILFNIFFYPIRRS